MGARGRRPAAAAALLALACKAPPPTTPLPPDGGSDVCTRLAYVFYLVAERREQGASRRDQLAALPESVDNPFTLHPGSAHESLRRVVEMYQWKENSKTETRKKVGGGEEKVTTYTYEKVWDDDLIDSSDFREAGHVNPGSMRYDAQEQVASLVTVGAFKLSAGLVAQIGGWETLRVDQGNLERATADVKTTVQLHDGQYYLGVDPASPASAAKRPSWSSR